MRYDKRREWTKMHVAFDVKTKEFLNFTLTDGRVNDCLEFRRVIEPVSNGLSEILGDKGYDTGDNFDFCRRRGITAKIPVKINATNRTSRSKGRRDAIVDQLGFQIRPASNKLNFKLTKKTKLRNQDEWKLRVNYGKRSLIESSFSTYKRILGEAIFSRKKNNVRKEIATKLNLFNLFSLSR
jgi:hypothetical protein